MKVKELYTINKNEDRKRFEFEAKDQGIGYLVSFFEVDGNEDKAWIAVEKASGLEPKPRKTNIWGADIEESDNFCKRITRNAGPRDQ